MEIKGEDYSIFFNEANNTIEFYGSIRLRGTDEYKKMNELLNEAHNKTNENLTLNFRYLQFLNSAGINTISKFVINSRKSNKIKLTVLGNKEIYWQNKSLPNLQKLWSEVQIEIN